MEMKFLLYLLSLLIGNVLSNNCNGTRTTTFKKEIIKTGLINPKRFSIDRKYNILYFNHGNTGKELGKLNLKINILVQFIDKLYSPCVDQKTHAVFLVNENGLYAYHPLTDLTKLLGGNNIDLNAVYYRNGIFVVKNRPRQLNRFIDGILHVIPKLQNESIWHFVVDKKTNIYFVNRELKSYKKGGEIVTYKGTDVLKYRGLAIDTSGEVYACTVSGIFKVDKLKHALRHVYTDKSCWGLDFDRDNNIIYSDGHSIVKLQKVSKCIGIN